jgi:hypothetical protein
MSYLEKTAKKLIPILVQLKKRMIPEKNVKDTNTTAKKGKIESIDLYQDDFNSDNDIDDSNPSKN